MESITERSVGELIFSDSFTSSNAYLERPSLYVLRPVLKRLVTRVPENVTAQR